MSVSCIDHMGQDSSINRCIINNKSTAQAVGNFQNINFKSICRAVFYLRLCICANHVAIEKMYNILIDRQNDFLLNKISEFFYFN